uniref:FBA_2 domain-containing protein n=1 Tax=Caenorhabditis tropicalis TaxID=1561998 RepID=A0A1I7V196_9PELO
MKPLTYQCLQMVLHEMSFLKRKELYAKCPAIRKQEERIGYKINEMEIRQYSNRCSISVDNFKIVFEEPPEDKMEKFVITMENKKTKITVKYSIDLILNEAAEKWVTYVLNRPDTKIQHLKLYAEPICILKCDPITIINLTMGIHSAAPEGRSSWVKTTVPVRHLEVGYVIRDDTMKTAPSVVISSARDIDFKILSAWQANKIIINAWLSLEQVVTYCTTITPKPIGFRCESWIEHMNMEYGTLDWLAGKASARKTTWNGKKCFTILLDAFSELNVHGNLDKFSNILIMEVNPRGTAIHR